jgi:RNA polymerase sigma factor (sigma-70 family)
MSTTQADVVLRQLRGLITAEQAARVPDRQLVERFATRHEETAFGALVKRHGRLVWGVCRRVLRNVHDAEDAFQATFLALVQKAGSVGKRGTVGGWLYRVAYHAALKARAREANRQRHERQVVAQPSTDLLAEVTGRELLAALDEELSRLPEKYRAPLVHCYLESQTCDEAARELGWSTSTLKRRLEEGRKRLRARLMRRGLSLPAVLLAAGLTPGGAPAAVPIALLGTAVKAGLRVAAGKGTAGTAAAPAAALAASVLRGLTLAKLKGAAVVLAMALLVVLGALALARTDRAPAHTAKKPAAAHDRPRPSQKPARPAAEVPKIMTVSGRVLDTGGKPVAGAEVAVVARGWNFAATNYQVLKKGKTDEEGRFLLTGVRLPSGEGVVLAGKSGYGLGQQALTPDAQRRTATFSLLPEQPLRGRLLDLEGLPAAGVKVSVMQIGTRDDVSLHAPPENLPKWPKPVKSDAKGRFMIAGLPRNTAAVLMIQDDRFAWQVLRLAADKGPKEKTWTLAPARQLAGKVVHADTGQPAVNARLDVLGITGRTDKNGRFQLRLSGARAPSMPPVKVYPAEGDPHLAVQQSVDWPRGAVKHRIAIKVPRGVLVRGKVMEARSGRPVAGAAVQFVPREAKDPFQPGVLTGYQNLAVTGTDGSFQVAVPPESGHLLVTGPGLDFIHQEVGSQMLTSGKSGGYRIRPDGLVKLELSAKSAPQKVKVQLHRGLTVRGRVLGPDGKPVAHGVMISALIRTALPSFSHVDIRDGWFALHGCDPGKIYPVFFLEPEHRWGASVRLAGKEGRGGSVSVRLTPCGKAVARFVDPQGKPLKDYPMKDFLLQMVVTPGPTYEEALRKGVLTADEEFAVNLVSRKERVAWKRFTTDAEGRFTYGGLIPGATYRLSVWDNKVGFVVKKEFRGQAEKTLELGNITIKHPR